GPAAGAAARTPAPREARASAAARRRAPAPRRAAACDLRCRWRVALRKAPSGPAGGLAVLRPPGSVRATSSWSCAWWTSARPSCCPSLSLSSPPSASSSREIFFRPAPPELATHDTDADPKRQFWIRRILRAIGLEKRRSRSARVARGHAAALSLSRRAPRSALRAARRHLAGGRSTAAAFAHPRGFPRRQPGAGLA